MKKKELLRRARKLAKERGLEDKITYQKNYKGDFRAINKYRNFIKRWMKQMKLVWKS